MENELNRIGNTGKKGIKKSQAGRKCTHNIYGTYRFVTTACGRMTSFLKVS